MSRLHEDAIFSSFEGGMNMDARSDRNSDLNKKDLISIRRDPVANKEFEGTSMRDIARLAASANP